MLQNLVIIGESTAQRVLKVAHPAIEGGNIHAQALDVDTNTAVLLDARNSKQTLGSL